MPDARSLRPSAIRDRVRRFTRRRRRPIAAALAAVGVLFALGSLRQQPTAVVEANGSPSAVSHVRPGEAAVPITLSSPAVVRSLVRGQVVDIVAVPREGEAEATIVAARARVIDIPEGGSALSASSTSVIVVAVRDQDALGLVASAARDGIGVVIRSPSESR